MNVATSRAARMGITGLRKRSGASNIKVEFERRATMGIRRGRRSGLRSRCVRFLVEATALALVGLLVGGAALSYGRVQREFETRITAIPATGPHGEPVPSPGPLSGVNALAAAGGKLTVAEVVEGQSVERVDRYAAATGEFLGQFPPVSGLEALREGVAVGSVPAERVYVGAVNAETVNGVVAVFDAAGTLLARWEGAKTSQGSFGFRGVSAVATDSSLSGSWTNGDIFVADPTNDAVYVFNPTLESAAEEETPPVAEITEIAGEALQFSESPLPAIAVNGYNGDVVVINGGNTVDVLEPTGLGEFALVRTIRQTPGGPLGGIAAVAADPSNGDIYVADEQTGEVYVYDVNGQFLEAITGAPAAFESVRGIAADPVSGRLFIADRRRKSGVIDIFGASVVVPDVTTDAATEVSFHEARLHGTVDTDNEGAGTCGFVWGVAADRLDRTVACEGPVAPGPPAAPVAAVLGGLEPDTTYYYRLQATSDANGKTNTGEASQTHELTTAGPGLVKESSEAVTATSAQLSAAVDPHGRPVHVYFEYGTEDCATAVHPCKTSVAPPGVPIGSGEGPVTGVRQAIEGLTPGTAYRYRLVVVDEVAPGESRTFFGHGSSFTTQSAASSGLLDGRSWELVSPPDKHGAGIEPVGNGALIQAAADGAAVSYGANAPTEAEPQGSANLVQVLSVRGSSGWASRDIAIPHETASGPAVGPEGEYRFFSDNLTESLVQPFGAFDAELSSEATEATPYLANDFSAADPTRLCTESCLHPLVTASNVPSGAHFGNQNCAIIKGSELYCGPAFVGATPDLKHVVLQSKIALSEGGGTGGYGGLYEWSGGTIVPVSVLPASEGGVAIGGQLGFKGADARHTISTDGSRVVWEGEETGSGPHIYLRDTARGETVRLDVPQPGAPAASQGKPRFQDASSDGSRIFFTDTVPLTEDSGAREEAPDLYECEAKLGVTGLECALRDLTPVGENESAAGVVGNIVGVSENGQYVYFVANGALVSEAEQGNCVGAFPPNAQCNLYTEHEGKTKLVAVLAGTDSPDWSSGEAELARQTSRVSPNGKWVAFMSDRALAGYDTTDAHSGQADEEVYLYDAAGKGGEGEIVCASCAPSGQLPVGQEYGPIGANMPLVGTAKIWEPYSWLSGDLPGWSAYSGFLALHQPNYLSDNGRLFFNSDDALAAGDTNGTWDVYEYEPSSVGSCSEQNPAFSSRSHGCVALVSSGTATEESALLDASATGGRDPLGQEGGGDVFFLTTARLSGADFDTSQDVYDAHECTASAPCLPERPATSEQCSTGESCKSAASPQPGIFAAPPTSGAVGEEVTPGQPGAGRSPARRAAQDRARLLSRALKVCRRERGKRRNRCEAAARRSYRAPRRKVSTTTSRGAK